ncbi:hypothetical protein ACIEHO_06655 [Jejuia sp. DST062]
MANWLKTIQVFSFFCFLLMCYYGLQLHKNALLCIAAFAAITFFYAIPFLPRHFFVDNQHNLRSISGLKIYLIALVWGGVTVFLPLVNNNYLFSTDIIITGVQRFAFVIVIMLPFEIRDLRYDSLKLSTVPQKIGVKQTKILGSILLLVVLLLEFFKDETSILYIVVLFAVSVVTALFLVFSKIEQGRYYSSFWVEGLPVFWLVLMLLFA